MMHKNVIDFLKKEFPKIKKTYHVRHLAIFGSVARGEATPKSDIDVLVEFENKATFDQYFNLKFFLEDNFHSHVDLVTKKAIKPRIRPYIEKDLIYVA